MACRSNADIKCCRRLGAAEEAQQVFDDMREKGMWQPADILTVNVFLNALSNNSEAAFERCAHPVRTLPPT